MDKQQTPDKQPAEKPINTRHVTIVKARHRRIAWIIISLCLVLMLSAGVLSVIQVLRGKPLEEGKIANNVIVGGVNIGGMTCEDAEIVVRLTIEEKLTSQDLVVRLEYDTLILSPQEIGLQLDVPALIQAAYSYGRSGSSTAQQDANREYHIALLPYLNLDLNIVYNKVKDFCANYRTALTQPSVELIGLRPEYTGTDDVAHQTMKITIGTPQWNLTADDLYSEVLDGYSLFQLELFYDPPVVVEPEKPDAQAIFERYCLPPQDATIDSKTFAVTPEVYGYGFNIAALQRRIARAEYGEVIELTLEFMMPDITAEALSGDLFRDVLATYTSHCSDSPNTNRNKNLKKACETINGYVIKVGESFDFNAIIGMLTTVHGYASAPAYSGSNLSIVGGGISQVASALHYCAWLAELQIDQRASHRYAVSYTPLGTDAAISETENLVFTNTTSAPIRILAEANGSDITITLLGTDERNYRVEIEHEILRTYLPHTSYQFMVRDNEYGYKDGQIIQNGITGYELVVFVCKYDLQNNQLISRKHIGVSAYDSRDQIVVQIGSELEPDGI